MEAQLSIIEAARRMKVSEQYVRYLIRTNQLAATKVPIKEDSMTLKYVVSQKAIDEWRPARSRRLDRRHKFTVYATDTEWERLMNLALTNGLEKVAAASGPANNRKTYEP